MNTKTSKRTFFFFFFFYTKRLDLTFLGKINPKQQEDNFCILLIKPVISRVISQFKYAFKLKPKSLKFN